jgi:TetR/AcrR family transcriptional repressor of mexJK operon
MAQISKRDKILETAGKLFMQNGFRAVSVDLIAASVPVSKPTLYAHFKDKRQLFTAVIAERCTRALASLKAGIDEGRTIEESLISFGRHFLDLLLSKEALQFQRVIIGESESFPDMAKMFYETGPSKTHNLLKQFLTRLHEKGILHVSDPQLSADIFLGMLRSRVHLKCLLGITKKVGEEEREKLIKTAVSIFIQGHKKN